MTCAFLGSSSSFRLRQKFCFCLGTIRKPKEAIIKANSLTKGPKVCSKLIATSIKHFEEKSKTPDNFKAESHNYMGFRNFTLKAFKIDPPKLEGLSSY